MIKLKHSKYMEYLSAFQDTALYSMIAFGEVIREGL